MFKVAAPFLNTQPRSSNNRPADTCKYTWFVSDDIATISNPIEKIFAVSNGRVIHQGFEMAPEIKIKGRQVWGAWWPLDGTIVGYQPATEDA